VVLGKGLHFYAGEQDCWFFEPVDTKQVLEMVARINEIGA